MGGNTRVVDQNVEAAKLIACCFERPPANCCVGYVARNANGMTTKLRDLSRDFSETIFAAREQHKINAMTCQLESQRSPDSAGCACDQCAPIS
jgi:hypothetical protein